MVLYYWNCFCYFYPDFIYSITAELEGVLTIKDWKGFAQLDLKVTNHLRWWHLSLTESSSTGPPGFSRELKSGAEFHSSQLHFNNVQILFNCPLSFNYFKLDFFPFSAPWSGFALKNDLSRLSWMMEKCEIHQFCTTSGKFLKFTYPPLKYKVSGFAGHCPAFGLPWSMQFTTSTAGP